MALPQHKIILSHTSTLCATKLYSMYNKKLQAALHAAVHRLSRHLAQRSPKTAVVTNLAAALATTIVLLRKSDMIYAIECPTRAKQAYGLTEAVVESYTTRMWWGHITMRSRIDKGFCTTIFSLSRNVCIRWA